MRSQPILPRGLNILTGALIIVFGLLLVWTAAFGGNLAEIPQGAVPVLQMLIPCSTTVILAKGYDANGNGDFEILELVASGVQLAVIYFMPPDEQVISRAIVRENGISRTYTNADEFLARYGSGEAFCLAAEAVGRKT